MPKGGQGIQRRRSIRLREYDYSWAGWYYVTVCMKDGEQSLGSITGAEVLLSPEGSIVDECWKDLPQSLSGIELDEFVVMPNHLHGIIIIPDQSRRGLINQTSTGEEGKPNWPLMKAREISLGRVVRHFKAKSSRLIHKRGYLSFRWQRNYFEHIIRNDGDLLRIRTYIRNNPIKWAVDEENPEVKKANLGLQG